MKRWSVPMLLFCLTPALCGCGKRDFVWSKSYTFASDRWQPETEVCFAPDSGKVNGVTPDAAILMVRYGQDISADTLWLVMETESLSKAKVSIDTISLPLIPSRLRNGERSTLGVFESCDTVALKLPYADGWSATVRPLVDTPLEDIFSITFDLIESATKH